jgi:bifunctional NMN adenylyltransferase/nudix hydrolase
LITALVPSPVVSFLKPFALNAAFSELCSEVDFLKKYKKQWEVAPYPVVFVTTDAVVEQAGHVLLITRKAFPGKGLYALPGGFLDANKDKSLLDGCLRELKEETKIELPSRVLRGSIKDTKAFDAIGRSNRGRTITHAFYFKLENNTVLPKVKASDDAESAQWVDISELTPENMYEDHYSIIKYFI